MMSKIIKLSYLLIFISIFSSCTEDDIVTGGNTILDGEVPLEAIESNYTVGAQYTRFTRSNNVPEEPSLGIYNGSIADPIVFEQHVNQAKTAGIDFFVFAYRSANNAAQNTNDVNYINTLQTATNAQDINFALSYNFANMGINNNNRIESAGFVQQFIDDFVSMSPFFNLPNYQKINGKNVVYILNAHNLFADDNAALYQQVRTELTNLGYELFLIGEQNEWTPTLRYDFRFVNGVDAVTHKTYAAINVNIDDRITLFEKIVDLAFQYHKETWTDFNIEYVPTISPSINIQIINSGSPINAFSKNEPWFREFCNLARRASGENRIVLVDSFNDWNRGTQLEAANTYGETYLDILKQEFKIN